MCILYLIVYNFTRFRCAENGTPQDHFRCVMGYANALACMPQRTRPAIIFLPYLKSLLYLSFVLHDYLSLPVECTLHDAHICLFIVQFCIFVVSNPFL